MSATARSAALRGGGLFGLWLILAGTAPADVPVGPACRLCPRRDCADRQEEALMPGGQPAAVRAPLIPRGFDIGEAG